MYALTVMVQIKASQTNVENIPGKNKNISREVNLMGDVLKGKSIQKITYAGVAAGNVRMNGHLTHDARWVACFRFLDLITSLIRPWTEALTAVPPLSTLARTFCNV